MSTIGLLGLQTLQTKVPLRRKIEELGNDLASEMVATEETVRRLI